MPRGKSAKNRKKKFNWNAAFFLSIFSALGAAAILHPLRRQLVVVGVVLGFSWFLYLYRKYRLASTMAEIDQMTGKQFEKFLARLFKRHGYRTVHVGAKGSDYGADLVVEKDNHKIAVQAKNYDTGRVGNDAVQQAVAGASFYDCEAAIVVTNSMFTRAAKQQAAGSNVPVSLWDRNTLRKALRK